MLQGIAFYVFSAVIIASALMVISARNPVHSVLFLILAFFNAAALFVLLGAEFLAMILVVVYVGAVAVLFLFVVMMLDIDFVALAQRVHELSAARHCARPGALQRVPGRGGRLDVRERRSAVRAVPLPEGVSNTEAIGRILYTDYIFYFQTAGMILLVAMIGAIVLTLRHRPGVKRQSISRQVARNPAIGDGAART